MMTRVWRYMLMLVCGLFIAIGGSELLFSGVLEILDVELLLEGAEVYAQSYDTTDTRSGSQNEIETANFLQLLLRGVYLLMRPLLAVAGAALDNTLVYGEMFFLNTSLRKMRQIMRNFANFALGGIFLFALLTRILSGGTMERGGTPTDLLKKILLAVIGIQASWFAMGLMLDLSTIAIYSVGALPLNILSQDLTKDGKTNDLKNIRFLKPLVNFSTDSTKSQDGTDASHSIFYTCNQANGSGLTADKAHGHNYKYFIPCRLEGGLFVPYGSEGRNNTWEDWKRKQTDARYAFKKGGGDGKTQGVTRDQIHDSISDDFCVWGNGLMNMRLDKKRNEYNNAKTEIEKIIRKQMERQNRSEEDILEAIATAIANISQSHIFGHPLDQCRVKRLTREATAKGVNGAKVAGGVMGQFECPTLYNLIDRSAGMTGPMYSLYASVMRMSDIALTPNHKGVVEISLEFMIKLLTSVMLILPLFALSIALIIRAVVLRGFIIFLPLLVIARVFFDIDSKAGGKASFSSLTGLIFMPVVAVFAISMSLLILTLFNSAEELLGGDYNVLRAFGIETEHPAGRQCLPVKDDVTGEIIDIRWKNADGKTDAVDCNTSSSCSAENMKCYSLFFTSICFEDSQRIFGNGIGDIFARLVVNFFGIGLMWMVVFAALGTSKITKGVTDSIQGLGKTLMTSLPIIPTPSGAMTSIGGLQQGARMTSKAIQRKFAPPVNDASDAADNLNAQYGQTSKNQLATLDAGATGTELNFTQGFDAAANTSILDYSNTYKGIQTHSKTKAKITNFTEAMNDPVAYSYLRGVGGDGGLNSITTRMSKQAGGAGRADKESIGKTIRKAFDARSKRGGDIVEMKKFRAGENGVNGDRLYLDKKYRELVKIKPENNRTKLTEFEHIPIPGAKELPEKMEEFNALMGYKEDLLTSNGPINDTYKKLMDPKTYASASISGSTVKDIKLGDKRYDVIYTDDSFSAIKEFDEIVPPSVAVQ